ncbi:hypothetical protein [Methanococcoides methylutens]|uniref:Uracil-DNA glycosylase-like domain-containing protein n=1 Tax=Methanococcoides methylutens MM1 TaxID=1434104 RepID=A0A0E3X1I9_METMT|nr:hypothetical protein [Methanococcoides methylutens]AKB85284.1 hypothetical protein MCMEM_1231 [Methanococcoides methylutens MM1]
MTTDTNRPNKDKNMRKIIEDVRNCDLECYSSKYTFPLNTRTNGKRRTISVEELKNAKPLIDDWREQQVLFVSQAPSKQAWVDNELSSLNNSFLTDFLLPKIYPDKSLNEALEQWKQAVFWVHTANCYPFVHTDGRSKGRDKAPDLRCANKYMDRFVNTMNPELIVLMGVSSTRFFSRSIRSEISSDKNYPSLKEILEWQYTNKKGLAVSSKSGKSEYRSIIIPHAANWDKLDEKEKYAYDLLFESLKRFCGR